MLPPEDLMERLQAVNVTPETVRRLTQGPDTLLSPLEPTRECVYSDEPAAVAVREVFCQGTWHVRFVRDLLIVSDFLTGAADAVMGAGETTAVLYRAARPASRVGGVLDLGCGAGTLALLLAKDADHITATDINPRAVAFCRYNARLNGIANLECLEGSLYEPVQGRQFDLIVSQPPYYPGSTEIFLHGGPWGHELAQQILQGTLDHLTPGGRAVIHTAWPVGDAVPAIPGARLTERTPGIGEVPGTRHSVLLLEHGSGVERINVPPERW